MKKRKNFEVIKFKENKNMADKPDKDAVFIEEKNLEGTQNTSDK